jgi:predicted  nucleic acid-binding Zn-ribbon protein
MHDDLVLISNLYQADVAADRARAALAGLEKAEADANAERDACTRELAAQHASFAALQDQARVNEQDLARWTETRATTQRRLDTGPPDWVTAERQLSAAVARIDTLETEGLALLDAIDAAQAAVTRAQRALQAAEATLTDRSHARTAQSPALEAARDAALARRAEAAEALPLAYRGTYADLRRRRKPALVNVVDGQCSACAMRVPPQRMVETQTDAAVHTCPGCTAYLLP